MTLPPREEASHASTSYDVNPALDRDTNPELRSSVAKPDSSVSRVEARRATRKLVRRKLQSPAPPIPKAEKEKQPLNPMWIGFGVSVVLGLAAWGAYSTFFPDGKSDEPIAAAGEEGDSIVGTTSDATLASLPAETADQVAAREETERQTAALKKK